MRSPSTPPGLWLKLMLATSRAVVRPPGNNFVDALSNHPERGSIDPELARRQHAEYRQVLASLGVRLIELPVSEELPDACFTADTAVILQGGGLGGVAAPLRTDPRAPEAANPPKSGWVLLARTGAPSRRDEVAQIERILFDLVEDVEQMEAPATLEGGDVLNFGTRVIVGRSERTNSEGIHRLTEFAQARGISIEGVDVPDGILHLGTAASPLGAGAALGLKEILDAPAFADLDRVIVPEDEAVAGNVVVIGDQVIAASGHAVTRRLLEDRGFTVHEVDLSEFAKADGGPSCLTLFV